MKRTAFFISDGTGITAETLGNSLLSQFEAIRFEKITLPYVDTIEKARAVVERINRQAQEDGKAPIVLDTIVDDEIRALLASCNGFKIDVFSTFLKPLEAELETHSSYTVGKSHAINELERYKDRIDAVNFALDNDDAPAPGNTIRPISYWWASPAAAKPPPASTWRYSLASAPPTTR